MWDKLYSKATTLNYRPMVYMYKCLCVTHHGIGPLIRRQAGTFVFDFWVDVCGVGHFHLHYGRRPQSVPGVRSKRPDGAIWVQVEYLDEVELCGTVHVRQHMHRRFHVRQRGSVDHEYDTGPQEPIHSIQQGDLSVYRAGVLDVRNNHGHDTSIRGVESGGLHVNAHERRPPRELLHDLALH